MMTTDTMSEYYKMCVAAGLNYYRKVPSVDDLLKLSVWRFNDFIWKYSLLTPQSANCKIKQFA
jgi:hypothetical protein